MMDKNAIKKYAIWARNELIARVTQKAEQYEITKKSIASADAESIGGRVLTAIEKKQRQALIAKIEVAGFEQVIEEVAYTWFNRFTALRFMEVNNYLPSRTRVFTNEAGEFKPQILTDAIQLELDGLDMDKVYEMKDANKTEELFKYLLITQCNALSSILPGMFQKIEDYTELLLPDYLLRESSVIEQLITMILEEDWTDQVQIIGWLYQYYNTEPKDKVFADLKKNIKITKDNIPAATQLFTPDWIVHYMVENSLGRLWLEGHPNAALKSEWKYYLDEAEQEVDVQIQLDAIRKEYAALKPEEIKCIDPCMGSGHILCYMFDVLVKIYEDYGYTAREATVSIVQNNLFGLDIDDRAAQLAYFSVMMKACQYDRRFLSRGIQPHIHSVIESDGLGSSTIDYFTNNNPKLKKDIETLVEELHDAKEYGSILNVSQVDFAALYTRIEEVLDDISIFRETVMNSVLPLIQVAEAMAQKYHVVVTNPPYMGSGGMSQKLSEFIKTNYADSKSDLFAVFIEKCGEMIKANGYYAMITQHSWMFLSSFEKLRRKLQYKSIINMAHLGSRAFDEIGGEVVQTSSFVNRNKIDNYKGNFVRLVDAVGENEKKNQFINGINRYVASQEDFRSIPGNVIVYWLSANMKNIFSLPPISNMSHACKGLDTADNNRFLRLWFEVSTTKMGLGKKWIPYNKGGGYRKWYGLNEYLIDWEDNGYEIKNNSAGNIRNESFYYKKGLTWSDLSTNSFGARYCNGGFIFDASGPMLFSDNLTYFCGYMNSIVYQKILDIICPGLHYNNGAISRTPIKIEESKGESVDKLVNENIDYSKSDWDSFETSWDFKSHPLIQSVFTVSEAYAAWSQEALDRFNQLKTNEEELNRIFIDIYGLQDELTPEVEDKDITVRKADLGRDIRSLISYAVGCMFGRYSLDVPGLVYAGGDFNTKYCRWISQFGDRATDEIDENGDLVHGGWAGSSSWKYDGVRSNGKWIPATFVPDTDNIIPICDDEYFENDVVVRFVKFIETVYGKETLEENLQFIAQALGGKGSSREVIRNYFLNDFYADHLKIYQKRPIYWLFDSGKKNGFKALIYMHRYQPDTIARIRTDYVHELQSRYRTAMADLEQHMSNASTSERVKLNKHLSTLQARAEEIRIYEEKIHHLADQMISIDLDDGVRHNYEIFKDVLAKIK